MTSGAGLRVGLTGGIASGKSMVARWFEEWGACLIDADVLAREVVDPGTPALAAIVERFGPSVLTPTGALDRARLGEIVFADDSARADLEAIVHPAVRAAAAAAEAACPPGGIVVHVIPLLVETGQAGDFDVLVVVDAPEDVQVARLGHRNGLDEAAARARLAAQASREERLAVADVVLVNDGDPADTRRAALAVWRGLEARRHGSRYP